MFKGIFKGRTEGPSANEYEMVNQSENPSSSQSGSVSTPSPTNGSEENVYNSHYDDEEGDNDDFNDESRDSIESQSSKLFADIGTYTMKNDEEVDDFNSNPIFHAVLRKYHGTDIIGRRILAVSGGLVVLLWIIGIIVYSRHSVGHILKNLNNQTNVQVSGQNITLNAYDPQFSNVTMERYKNGQYYAYRTEVTWLNIYQYPKSHPGGGYYMTKGPNGSYLIRQLDTDYSATLIDDKKFAYRNDFFEIEDFILNPSHSIEQLNDNYHMIVTDKTTQWRHSSFALYWLLNPITGEFIPIQPPKNEKELEAADNMLKQEVLDKLHFAEFSPHGDYVVYGFDHDLYLLDLSSMETHQITTSGSPNIFNGKSDWVYEEEVVATDKLFWWSPDQTHLIFASLNDTFVESYELDYYVKDRVEVGAQYKESDEEKYRGVNQYPIKTSIKYPKPGTANPIVTFYKFTLAEKLAIQLKNDNNNVGNDFLLYDAVWIDNENFLTKQTDRTSTILTKKLLQIHKSNDFKEINSINVADTFNGWVEKQNPVAILTNKDGDENQYIDKVVINGRTTLAIFDSASSQSYSHILVNNDNWDVLPASPVVFDKQENYVYFLSTIKSSMDAHLMAIDMSSENYNLISMTDIDKDGSYDISFSQDGQYLNLYYKGPLQPWQRLINMAKIHDVLKDDSSAGSTIDSVIMSEPIINHVEITTNKLKKVNLPTKVYKTIQIGKYDDNSPININVIEILPPNFNPDRRGKYPILVHAYGGPGSQTVDKSFDIDFQHVVSATLDAVVLIIDPRGTGGQGWKFRAFAKDKIGYWEPRDITMFVTDYIKVNAHFVDKEKIAIWGWSYGGFTTLKTLEFDEGSVFKYGMAVAPVTNWLFYDSVYTERYMNEPVDNENYDKYSRINNFDSFKQLNRFLIMHGTADDNVHLQNSLWLLDNFNLHSVENYDVHFFPDSDHGIYYHNAQSIVYDKLLHWLRDAFAGRFNDFI